MDWIEYVWNLFVEKRNLGIKRGSERPWSGLGWGWVLLRIRGASIDRKKGVWASLEWVRVGGRGSFCKEEKVRLVMCERRASVSGMD